MLAESCANPEFWFDFFELNSKQELYSVSFQFTIERLQCFGSSSGAGSKIGNSSNFTEQSYWIKKAIEFDSIWLSSEFPARTECAILWMRTVCAEEKIFVCVAEKKTLWQCRRFTVFSLAKRQLTGWSGVNSIHEVAQRLTSAVLLVWWLSVPRFRWICFRSFLVC